jgi:hypothetical protein
VYEINRVADDPKQANGPAGQKSEEVCSLHHQGKTCQQENVSYRIKIWDRQIRQIQPKKHPVLPGLYDSRPVPNPGFQRGNEDSASETDQHELGKLGQLHSNDMRIETAAQKSPGESTTASSSGKTTPGMGAEGRTSTPA